MPPIQIQYISYLFYVQWILPSIYRDNEGNYIYNLSSWVMYLFVIADKKYHQYPAKIEDWFTIFFKVTEYHGHSIPILEYLSSST